MEDKLYISLATYNMESYYMHLFSDFQFQIYYPEEIEVVVKKLQPEDLDDKFLEHNGISKMCGVECRTWLQQLAGYVPAAVKGEFAGYIPAAVKGAFVYKLLVIYIFMIYKELINSWWVYSCCSERKSNY